MYTINLKNNDLRKFEMKVKTLNTAVQLLIEYTNSYSGFEYKVTEDESKSTVLCGLIP